MEKIVANVPLIGDGAFEILIEKERITAVEPVDTDTDLYAGPSLFDIQVNGYAGRTCRIPSPDKKDALAWVSRVFAELGVGWWVPTITTGSREQLFTAFKLCGEALDEDPETAARIPGLHLEGPYISPVEGPRGAHLLEFVRKPDWDEFQRMQEASGGRIKYITVAPEVEGCIDFIRKCVDSGVVVSLGHTNMDRESFRKAVDAGATLSTHLGNGAHDLIQRHNNYIWYQLAERRSYAGLITDGQHLPPECLYSLVHAKGLDKTIIVSDTVELGGMPAGVYNVRSRKIEKLPSGRIVLSGTPNLSGSSSNLRECLEIVIRDAKLSLAEAWRLASLNPAKALGLDNRLGLEPGKEATLTILKYREAEKNSGKAPSVEIVETWVAGKKIYEAGKTPRFEMPSEPIDIGDA